MGTRTINVFNFKIVVNNDLQKRAINMEKNLSGKMFKIVPEISDK